MSDSVKKALIKIEKNRIRSQALKMMIKRLSRSKVSGKRARRPSTSSSSSSSDSEPKRRRVRDLSPPSSDDEVVEVSADRVEPQPGEADGEGGSAAPPPPVSHALSPPPAYDEIEVVESVNTRKVTMADELLITISSSEREELEAGLGEGGSALQPPPVPQQQLPPPPPQPASILQTAGGPILRWDPACNSFVLAKAIDSISLDSIDFNIDAIKGLGRSLIPCAPFQTGHCGKSSLVHFGNGACAAKEYAHVCCVCYRLSGLPLMHNLKKCPHCVSD